MEQEPHAGDGAPGGDNPVVTDPKPAPADPALDALKAQIAERDAELAQFRSQQAERDAAKKAAEEAAALERGEFDTLIAGKEQQIAALAAKAERYDAFVEQTRKANEAAAKKLTSAQRGAIDGIEDPFTVQRLISVMQGADGPKDPGPKRGDGKPQITDWHRAYAKRMGLEPEWVATNIPAPKEAS
jgi:hypothetical protein